MLVRHRFAALGMLLLFAGVSSARAESRVFVIANIADGYGVDRCLATGASCGQLVANAYCRSQEFTQVVSFRKIEPTEVTGSATPAGATCAGGCGELVAIECAR